MAQYDYIIAGLRLRSDVDITALGLRSFKPFEVAVSDDAADCTISKSDDISIDKYAGISELYSSYMSESNTDGTLYKTEYGYLYTLASRCDKSEPLQLYIDTTTWHISMNVDSEIHNVAVLRFGLWVAFGIVFIHRGVIAIHSSVVEHCNKAVLFLGESGTGKSTHTRLWCENIEGAKLLNDDSPIIRVVDGKIRVYGSPWSGKTPCYRTDNYPLAAICRLSQATENRINRLKIIAAIGALLPSTPPQFAHDAELQDLVLSTLGKIIAQVPTYHLECLPNSEAANLAYKTFFSEQRVLNNIELLVDVGSDFEIRVTGYSMLPLLGHPGDRIIVRRTDGKEPIEGCIAMFRTENGNIVVHRVISVDNEMVTLRGDGNLTQSEQARREDIIGVVKSVRRRSGEVVECTSRAWRRRERLWLSLPYALRRYSLALLHRWLDYKNKKV